jgi:hypothetical protein
MVLRVVIALVGAVVITAGLLLGMDAVTSVVREVDYHRYYRISDVFARPADRKPDRPEARERPPELPAAADQAPQNTNSAAPTIEPSAPEPAPGLTIPGIEPPDPDAVGR